MGILNITNLTDNPENDIRNKYLSAFEEIEEEKGIKIESIDKLAFIENQIDSLEEYMEEAQGKELLGIIDNYLINLDYREEILENFDLAYYESNEIDYYGTKDNYIHAKFGNLYKMYNFTEDFIEEYKEFAEEYKKYFEGEKSIFKKPQDILDYVKKHDIPVNFYFNFTDTPAESIEEVEEWLRDNE